MKRKKVSSHRIIPTYELIDWHFPKYQEFKPGSTDRAALALEITGLTTGLYIWQLTYIREVKADRSRCDWQIGTQSHGGISDVARPATTFEACLEAGRAALAETELPIWADDRDLNYNRVRFHLETFGPTRKDSMQSIFGDWQPLVDMERQGLLQSTFIDVDGSPYHAYKLPEVGHFEAA